MRRAAAVTLWWLAKCALAVCALEAALAPGAAAQDLAPRKGFSVKITAPKSNDVLVGEVTIRAEVAVRREEDVERVDFFLDDKLLLADSEPPYQVVHNFGKSTTTHVIRVVAHHRDGPTASDFIITRAAEYQYVVNVQRVVLDVSVRDDKRRVVTGLSAGDFTVTEENRPQKVLSVSPDKRPVLVALLLDTSGSMRDRLKEAQEAACRFTATLGDADRAFVVQFDDQVTLLEDITSDRDAMCRAVRGTTAVGETELWDAIHASNRVIHESPSERRAMVLLTDGDDTGSRLTWDEIFEEARLNDVTFYAIGLDVEALSGARGRLEKLAEETGGRAFCVKKADELAGIYELIAEELRTLYQLVYASDNQVFDNRFLKIKIEVKGGAKYDVAHRAGYRAVQP